MRKLFLVLCLCLGAVNAAQAAFFSDDEAREKIVDLQKQLVQMQSQIQALQGKLDEEQKQRQAVDGRVATVENQLRSQSLIDLLNQVERLNTDISQLKGQMEVMAHDMEGTQQRQRDLYTDLDSRLRKLESAPAQAAAPAAAEPAQQAAAPTASTPAPEAAPAPTTADNEVKDYEAAFALFKGNKYAQAAEAFDKFQQTYPDSKLAGNAQYWAGTARFSQRDYKGALAAQQKLLKTYPDHEKAPDAMYSIANCQIQLSDLDAARQTLKTLVTKFPQAKITPKAKERLSQLESLKKK
jgi:tol-pal system protein YbgF